ncbi:MAG: endo-1,4-beta-xylanase [Defluviitaleaceae bacterium]|nr:endo-1,4-beta-xylanase [Defluviitaleaceae bacterium]
MQVLSFRRLGAVLLIAIAFLVLTPATALAQQWRVVYSLNDDFSVQIREHGTTFTTWGLLRNAGGPLLTTVAHPNGGNSIQLSNRNANWYTIDIFSGIFHFEENNYRITLRGRMPEGNVFLGGVSSPWGPLTEEVAVVDGAFELVAYVNTATMEATEGGIEQFRYGFRVGVDNDGDFIIDDIIVETDGEYLGYQFDLDLPSLRERFAPYFILGAAWGSPAEKDANFREFYLQHFASITAGNHHKPDFIVRMPAGWSTPTPPPDEYWDFTLADYFVDFAENNNINMIGHTLAWHGQSPPWLTGGVPNHPNIPLATREQAKENLRMYIERVAGRYSGRIFSWDVFNEIFTHAGTWGGLNMNTQPDWRFHLRSNARGGLADYNLRWFDAFANGADEDAGECGSDFVFYAFYFARRYDPYAILYYNDYGDTWYHKSRAISAMIVDINNRWRRHPSYDGRLLIEAMGMQAHYSNSLNFNLLSAAMDRYLETGVNISLTELDIELFGENRDRSRVPTDAEFERQAYVFTRVIQYALERHERVNRVTFWSLVDNGSQFWLHGRYANIFYENHQPKQAFWDIAALVDDPTPLAAPSITSEAVLEGNYGRAFPHRIAANGATPVITWSIESGSLPEGLRLLPSTGQIFGVPQEEGDFTVTFLAENQFGSDTATITLSIGEYVPREPTPSPTPTPTPTPIPTPMPAPPAATPTPEPFPDEPTPAAAEPTPEPPTQPAPQPEESTARNFVVWIIAAVILVGAVVVFFVLKRPAKKD